MTSSHAGSAVIGWSGQDRHFLRAYLLGHGWKIAVTDTRGNPPELAKLRAQEKPVLPQVPTSCGGVWLVI